MTSLPAVYVIDPDPSARQFTLSQCASMNVHTVGYGSAEEFLNSGTISFPGCLVCETELPGLSGVDLQTRLVRDAIALPFVFLTRNGAVATIVQAMKQGAITVLAKTGQRAALESAIREALKLSERMRQKLQEVAAMRRRLETLSVGEYQVLELILAGQTNKAIAKRLDVAVRTVEARRQQIFRKTNTGSLAELVKFALATMNSNGEAGAKEAVLSGHS